MNKKIKKLSVLPLILAMFLVLVACGSNQDESTENGDSQTDVEETTDSDNLRIGLSISTLNNPFFVTLADGAEEKIKDVNGEMILLDANDKISKQVSDVEDLIQQNVDVIIINPTDGDGIVPAVEEANKANIPVVTIDRAVSGGDITSHIASDNIYGGEIAAEFILEMLENEGNVVEIEGVQGASATIERNEGFMNIMSNENDIDIVASQVANFDRAEGVTTMENILQGQPKIDAVFAHNDEMALGALEAIEAAGRADEIILVGFDGIDDARDAIIDGRMEATVEEQAGKMGNLGMEIAIKIANDEEVESEIPLEVRLLTQEILSEE